LWDLCVDRSVMLKCEGVDWINLAKCGVHCVGGGSFEHFNDTCIKGG